MIRLIEDNMLRAALLFVVLMRPAAVPVRRCGVTIAKKTSEIQLPSVMDAGRQAAAQ